MARAAFGIVLVASMTWACVDRESDTPLGQAAARGDTAAIRKLLAAGADPNGFDGHGGTALIGAARMGHVAAAEALLAAGARADLRDRAHSAWTPLMHAVHKRQTEAARVLLDHGADPNARGGAGVTALIMSAAYGDTETVRLLLERGADARLRADGGVTALGNAAGGGGLFDITDGPGLGVCHPDTVRLLLARAPDLAVPAGTGGLSSWLARGRGCDEARALIAGRRS
jgi:uncharacterized protein